MVNRPFKDKRPLGPFLDSDQDDSEEFDIDAEDEDVDIKAIVEQAEDWYQSIAKKSKKREMMFNYLSSVTDLPEDRIERILERANL